MARTRTYELEVESSADHCLATLFYWSGELTRSSGDKYKKKIVLAAGMGQTDDQAVANCMDQFLNRGTQAA